MEPLVNINMTFYFGIVRNKISPSLGKKFISLNSNDLDPIKAMLLEAQTGREGERDLLSTKCL